MNLSPFLRIASLINASAWVGAPSNHRVLVIYDKHTENFWFAEANFLNNYKMIPHPFHNYPPEITAKLLFVIQQAFLL